MFGFKFIDLFAGCGGLSLGLERCRRFSPVAFTEINADAKGSYLANRRDPAWLRGRVNPHHYQTTDELLLDQSSSRWRGIDLVCGGPPCQGYSVRGRRRTQHVEPDDVPSNRLYVEMVQAIKAFQPRMFLFENVRGITTARWRRDSTRTIFEDVVAEFDSLHKEYAMASCVIRACDYGVPQLRRRVLLVGIHRDLRPSAPVAGVAVGQALEMGLIPEGTHSTRPLIDKKPFPPHPKEVIGDLVDPRFVRDPQNYRKTDQYPWEAQGKFQKRMRRRKGHQGARLTEHDYSKHRPETIAKYSALVKEKSLPREYWTKKFALLLLPEKWSPTGPTIAITSLADDFVHYKQPRTLTVRECARFQTFPDNYVLVGKRTTGGHLRAGRPSDGIWHRDLPKYTQIANAVPVDLAAELGRHFAKLLRNAV
jgi:DNA (cytosine-5)-methyltransferase 1